MVQKKAETRVVQMDLNLVKMMVLMKAQMMVVRTALLTVDYSYSVFQKEFGWALMMVAMMALLMVDYFYSAFLTELHWALKMVEGSAPTKVLLTVDCLVLLRDLCWESSTPMD